MLPQRSATVRCVVESPSRPDAVRAAAWPPPWLYGHGLPASWGVGSAFRLISDLRSAANASESRPRSGTST